MFKHGSPYGSRINVIMLVFTVFTRVQEDILKLVREYDMKSYIVVVIDGKIFRSVKVFLLTNNLFNFYVITRSSNPEKYFIYKICAFCAFGITDLSLGNNWELDHKFEKPMIYESSFKKQFFGGHLN